MLPPGEREMIIPGNMATVIVNQTDSLILPQMEFSVRDPVFYNAMRTDVSIDFQNHGIYIYIYQLSIRYRKGVYSQEKNPDSQFKKRNKIFVRQK